MFDIGWTELLVIAVVAVIIVGPKDLPDMLRTLGRYAGKLKRTAGEFRSQFDDALRDSELDELRSTMSGMNDMNPLNQIRDGIGEGLNPLKDTADDIRKGIEGASGGGSGGRMNTDPAPSRAASAKKSTAKASAAKKSPPRATAGKKPSTAKSGKSARAKKPAARKKPASARSSAKSGR